VTTPNSPETSAAGTPIEAWNSLLRPDVELSADYWQELSARMRAARLTFGDRFLCPFLRPFFLSEADEHRVRHVAEAMAVIGEKVVQAALARPELLQYLRLTPDEQRLARIAPGYKTASTASRLDAFLLPGSLKFAEYNAESPAGLGYSETMAEIFDTLEITQRFRDTYGGARYFRLADAMLDALLASYREWGGRADPPVILITDWREVPTWTEFLMLRDRFGARGVKVIVADPRDLTFEGGKLIAEGQAIDLVYRRVLIADIIAREAECRPLLDAYEQRAVCMANTLQCKIPHKKAFFAVLTDDAYASLFTAADRALISQHVPWTRVLSEGRTSRGGEDIDLLPHVRAWREDLVIKPNDEYGGSGVVLGWEADAKKWDEAIDNAISGNDGAWIVQARIPVRREVFPIVTAPGQIDMRDMLVDFAPYLFRGKLAGFLTRLSSTGLANVTSGGGQVPAFVVSRKA
jgi:uncharacterized circularly permuted ATP-grasp superfamily protein